MNFSDAQLSVIDFLQNGTESCLISGVAGSGKSTVIRHYQQWRKDQGLAEVPVVAPTGVAALNVGGSTIHKLFGLRPQTDTTELRVRLDERVSRRLNGLRELIVDEVSMVRADVFSYMDRALRAAKGNKLPFGGVRMLFVGDYWQLPPVVQRVEELMMADKFGSRAGWNFLCPAFNELAPRVFFFGESFRQGDDAEFAALLNTVRDNDPTACKRVNKTAQRSDEAPDTAPWLCATRKQVDARNAHGLRSVDGEERVLEPIVSGDRTKAPKEVLTPITLRLGCRVMITRNRPSGLAEGGNYVNGSVGTLVDFDGRCAVHVGNECSVEDCLVVRLDSGEEVYVPKATDDVIEYVAAKDDDGRPTVEKRVVVEISRFPIALGYAWTIHKSQGQTLQNAVIDMGRGAFAHGMTYVALSRVVASEGLYLATPLKPRDMKLDPAVPAFFADHAI